MMQIQIPDDRLGAVRSGRLPKNMATQRRSTFTFAFLKEWGIHVSFHLGCVCCVRCCFLYVVLELELPCDGEGLESRGSNKNQQTELPTGL